MLRKMTSLVGTTLPANKNCPKSVGCQPDMTFLVWRDKPAGFGDDREKTCNTYKMLPPQQWLWGPQQCWPSRHWPTGWPMPGCSPVPAGDLLTCTHSPGAGASRKCQAPERAWLSDWHTLQPGVRASPMPGQPLPGERSPTAAAHGDSMRWQRREDHGDHRRWQRRDGSTG